MYSTIKKKKCKGNCGRMPSLGLSGFCWSCVPEEIKSKFTSKRELTVKNQNIRKSISAKLRSDNFKEQEKQGSNFLELYFLLSRTKMTGTCQEQGCGRSTNKEDDKYYRWSVCHIVPKGLVKSVAVHPDNFIELCPLHHQEFDSTFERQTKMQCFAEAKRKFQLFKDLIPNEELRKINPALL